MVDNYKEKKIFIKGFSLKWIGITGSIGTGKSTVSNLIRDLGFAVLDADDIAKQQLEKGTQGFQEVVKSFGSSILNDVGEIDKKKLAEAVFGNQKDLARLEGIIHPLVQQEVVRLKNRYQNQGAPVLFYDVPLLFEKKMEKKFDAVLLVACNPENQFKRIQKRNSWSIEEIKRRLENQLPLEYKREKSQFIIENDGSLEELKIKTSQVVDSLRK